MDQADDRGPQGSNRSKVNDWSTGMESKTLLHLAREACKTAPTIDAAVLEIRKRIDAEGLYQELAEQMVRSAIREAVHTIRHQQLSGLKSNNCTRGLDAIASTSGVMTRSLLDSWPMPWGGCLGDATIESLAPLAETEREKAVGSTINAIFYESIIKNGKTGKRVRECLDGAEISRLLDDAKNRAAGHGTDVSPPPPARRPDSNGKAVGHDVFENQRTTAGRSKVNGNKSGQNTRDALRAPARRPHSNSKTKAAGQLSNVTRPPPASRPEPLAAKSAH